MDLWVAAVTGLSAKMLPWDLARAGGITAYLMLVAAVTLGVVESTPRLGHVRPVRQITHHYHRHVMLFALAFVVVHVTTLVLDPYAGVSLAAVFVPGLSQYRPVAVSLGTLALLAGILVGATAWFPARFPRLWLTLHRFGAGIFVLVWLHAVASGTDTPRLEAMYVATGLLPLAVAIGRYLITRPQRRAGRASPRMRAPNAVPDEGDGGASPAGGG